MTITAVSTNDAALRNFKFQIRDASSCDGDGYRPGRPSPTEGEEEGTSLEFVLDEEWAVIGMAGADIRLRGSCKGCEKCNQKDLQLTGPSAQRMPSLLASPS